MSANNNLNNKKLQTNIKKTNQKNVNILKQKNSNLIQLNSGETIISKKLKIGLIVGIIAHAVLLIVSMFLNGFLIVKINEISRQSQSLLTSSEIQIFENQSSNLGLSILNNVVSGVSYPQRVKIKAETLSNLQVVRAKATLTNSDGESYVVGMATNSNWSVGADGYVYYNGVFDGLSDLDLCSGIILPANFSSNNKHVGSHVVVITAESLDFNNALALMVWKTAPTEWLTNFGSGNLA